MASAASGASSASGAATVNPYIKPGPVSATAGYGWGTGTWGRGTWGSASTASNLIIDPASWSIDNFGQVMIATVKNGKLFLGIL